MKLVWMFRTQFLSEEELKEEGKSKNRFRSDLMCGVILLPIRKRRSHFFEWVVDNVNHEYLHHILYHIGEKKAGYELDSLGYNLATGCYYKEEGIT